MKEGLPSVEPGIESESSPSLELKAGLQSAKEASRPFFRKLAENIPEKAREALRPGLVAMAILLSSEMALAANRALEEVEAPAAQVEAAEAGARPVMPGLRRAPELPRPPEQALAAIEKFLQTEKWSKLEIEVQLPGKQFASILTLDSSNLDFLRGMKDEPLLAKGSVIVRIIRGVPAALPGRPVEDEDRGTLNGLPMIEATVDAYGNLLIIERNIETALRDSRSSDWTIWERATIAPPLPLARNAEGQPQPTAVNFEIPFAGGRIEGLLYLETARPLFLVEEYRVYSNLPEASAEVQAKFERSLREASAGLRRVESLFRGRQPFIKAIEILGSGKDAGDWEASNAMVSKHTPEIIRFYDDILLEEGKNHELIGFHEGVHSVDIQMGISWHPLFISAFRALPLEFFKALDEMNFLKGLGMEGAGHSEQNELEFFASLLNSLNHPDWERRISEAEPEFRSGYLLSLKAARQAVAECGWQALPKEASIFRLLDERIGFLKSGTGN